MQKWNYLLVSVERIGEVSTLYTNYNKIMLGEDNTFVLKVLEYLNSLGEQGWEMVSSQNREHGFIDYYFKRPID